MCTSNVIQDKFDPASWIMRKMDWAGAVNPAAELSRAIERKTPGLKKLGFVKNPTETEKREESINRSPSRVLALQGRNTAPSAHSQNIQRAIGKRGSV